MRQRIGMLVHQVIYLSDASGLKSFDVMTDVRVSGWFWVGFGLLGSSPSTYECPV
jgi:hypothetical protein